MNLVTITKFYWCFTIKEKYISKNISYKIFQAHFKNFFTIILSIIIFSNYSLIESYGESYSSKILEIRCIHLYEKYKMMGEDDLRKRYPAKTILNSCINLYKNPQWNFDDKNLIDEKYPSDIKDKLNSKILSYTKIGQSKFLVKFQICSEMSYKSRYLLITTDLEKYVGTISRPNSDSCVSLWSVLCSENPENVKFSWQYSNPSNFQNIRKLK